VDGTGVTLTRVVALGSEANIVVVLQNVELLCQTHPVLVSDAVLGVPQPLGTGTKLRFPRGSAGPVWDGIGNGGRSPSLLPAVLRGLGGRRRGLAAFLKTRLLLLLILVCGHWPIRELQGWHLRGRTFAAARASGGIRQA
jgi:hypothetical protein